MVIQTWLGNARNTDLDNRVRAASRHASNGSVFLVQSNLDDTRIFAFTDDIATWRYIRNRNQCGIIVFDIYRGRIRSANIWQWTRWDGSIVNRQGCVFRPKCCVVDSTLNDHIVFGCQLDKTLGIASFNDDSHFTACNGQWSVEIARTWVRFNRQIVIGITIGWIANLANPCDSG